MKKLFLLASMVVFLLLACDRSDILNVMTFNIRYANPDDGVNIWDNRKEMAARVFGEKSIDIAGLQEVLKHQLDDLAKPLSEYQVYGIGRDDGQEAGEFCPIIFRKERFELLDKNTFWLSETPEKPGNLCWNTVCNRVCSWVKLKDKKSGEVLYFFNTHFSHVSDEARQKSADMVLTEIAKIADKERIILTGDFNLTMDSDAYQTIISHSEMKLYDASSVHTFSEYDHTFNGWGKVDPKPVIDYVFVSAGLKIENYEIYKKEKEGVYISDHYPVIVKIK
ncbi:MAG: endonuclease/exonuclease/phosphatase family protein [Candidatus Marinimicrobia bacterium]|nr:endonuclease/exonuclease/phosphatase family protein [Candidatus Neomarinimicrobiota bacterium]